MFTMRGCANPLVWVSNEPAGGWLFILGLLAYLAVSTWSVGYEFACMCTPLRRRRRRGPGDCCGGDLAASRPTPSPPPAAWPCLSSSSSLPLVNSTYTSGNLFFSGLLQILPSRPDLFTLSLSSRLLSSRILSSRLLRVYQLLLTLSAFGVFLSSPRLLGLLVQT